MKKFTSFFQVLKEIHTKESWFLFSASRCIWPRDLWRHSFSCVCRLFCRTRVCVCKDGAVVERWIALASFSTCDTHTVISWQCRLCKLLYLPRALVYCAFSLCIFASALQSFSFIARLISRPRSQFSVVCNLLLASCWQLTICLLRQSL